jgi:hypothetical protein
MAKSKSVRTRFSPAVFSWTFDGRTKDWRMQTADAPPLLGIVSPSGPWIVWGLDSSGKRHTWAGPADGIGFGKTYAEQAAVILRHRIEVANLKFDAAGK